MRDTRPHVTLKLAISADGKAGLAGRRPVAITGAESQARVHLIRANHDAILIGIGTAMADDPQLTCRLPGMEARSPVRVVLDRGLKLPQEGRLVSSASEVPVWVLTSTRAPADAEAALRARGVVVLRVREMAGALDLVEVLRLLSARGIARLMIEGGPTVAAAFLAAGLVDEAAIFRSPKNIGAGGIDALEGMPLEALTQSPMLAWRGVEAMGADTLETFTSRGA